MTHKVYSIYQAKARFSEIIRIVKHRQRVIITDQGTPVAEVVPYRTEQPESIEGRIAKLAQIGAIIPSQEPFRATPVRLVPGRATDSWLRIEIERCPRESHTSTPRF